jgi:hypothetical protein
MSKFGYAVGFKKENSYFTPDISDLFVGYECEEPILDYSSTGPSKEWKKKVVGDDWDGNLDLREGSLPKLIHPQLIRTPYLTKEQIESEGWVQEQESPNGYLYYFEKTSGKYASSKKWGLKYYSHSTYLSPISLRFYIKNEPFAYDAYEGWSEEVEYECKSINEFRKICKFLAI